MAIDICPHKANRSACPLCFQVDSRKKAAQPPPARVNLSPQFDQGKVVTAKDVQTNPVLAKQMAMKQQALDAAAAKMGANPGITAAANAPMPAAPQVKPAAKVMGGVQREEVNPHATSSRKRTRVESLPQTADDNSGVYIDDGEIAELAHLYPQRPSIIDRQPSHPEGVNSGRGSMRQSAGRPVITKGKRPT